MAANPVELAAQGVRTLRAFSNRSPIGGGIIAPSLDGVVTGRTVLITLPLVRTPMIAPTKIYDRSRRSAPRRQAT